MRIRVSNKDLALRLISANRNNCTYLAFSEIYAAVSNDPDMAYMNLIMHRSERKMLPENFVQICNTD